MRASTPGSPAVSPSGGQVLLHRSRVPPGSAAPELDGDVDERANVVVGGAEVDEARPQADLAVDSGGRHPDARVVLERAHEQRVAAFRSVAEPRCRNGTIESGGGPQRGSSWSCSSTSS